MHVFRLSLLNAIYTLAISIQVKRDRNHCVENEKDLISFQLCEVGTEHRIVRYRNEAFREEGYRFFA